MAAAEELRKQITKLEHLLEEIGQTEVKIKHMAYMDQTRKALAESKVALESHVRTLTSVVAVLQDVCREYSKTDKKIADRYNLDTVEYPETRFDISKITGLEEYQSLMPF